MEKRIYQTLLPSDLKHNIKQIITKRWQKLWDENTQNGLYQIEPLLKERKREANKTRREETILSRQRIGHTRLTHDFNLKEESPPKFPCGKHYTIRHILIECTNLLLCFDLRPGPQKMLFQGDAPEGSETFQWQLGEEIAWAEIG